MPIRLACALAVTCLGWAAGSRLAAPRLARPVEPTSSRPASFRGVSPGSSEIRRLCEPHLAGRHAPAPLGDCILRSPNGMFEYRLDIPGPKQQVKQEVSSNNQDIRNGLGQIREVRLASAGRRLSCQHLRSGCLVARLKEVFEEKNLIRIPLMQLDAC